MHGFHVVSKCQVGEYQLEQSLHQVDAVAVLRRAESWSMRVIEEPAREGQAFDVKNNKQYNISFKIAIIYIL